MGCWFGCAYEILCRLASVSIGGAAKPRNSLQNSETAPILGTTRHGASRAKHSGTASVSPSQTASCSVGESDAGEGPRSDRDNKGKDRVSVALSNIVHSMCHTIYASAV